MPRMRCHYEVLSLARDADVAAIKKSYRKLALQYHPDKNADNIEESTKLFNEVQAAYDCLSDPQERAFYDKHREAILMGNADFVDETLNLMPYFSTSAFEGFRDDDHGFYSVYKEVFKKIAEEDEAHLEGSDCDDYDVPPQFGDSKSSFEDTVRVFYSYWQGYSTKKSYGWIVKYDIRQAPNRPTQRLMEKENKKVRDKKKKERNEEVRALVAFVRKRDKRVIAYRKELEAKQKDQKEKFEKKRLEEKKNRLKDIDNYEEPEWMKMDNMQTELDSIEKSLDSQFGGHQESYLESDEEFVEEAFYCVACDKTFKSSRALTNHEQSKKHKENIELIKLEMTQDMLKDLNLNDATDVGAGVGARVADEGTYEDLRGDVDVDDINDFDDEDICEIDLDSIKGQNCNLKKGKSANNVELDNENDSNTVSTEDVNLDGVEINEDLFDDEFFNENEDNMTTKKTKKKQNKTKEPYAMEDTIKPTSEFNVPLPENAKSKNSKKAKKMRRKLNKQIDDEDDDNSTAVNENIDEANVSPSSNIREEIDSSKKQTKQKKKPRRRKKKDENDSDEEETKEDNKPGQMEVVENEEGRQEPGIESQNKAIGDDVKGGVNNDSDDNSNVSKSLHAGSTGLTSQAHDKGGEKRTFEGGSLHDEQENVCSAGVEGTPPNNTKPCIFEMDRTTYAFDPCSNDEISIVLPDAPNLKKELQKLKETNNQESNAAAGGDSADEGNRTEHTCKVCSKSFPSKNKLFGHVKSMGHAALKTDDGEDSSEKGKKKKNKGKNKKMK